MTEPSGAQDPAPSPGRAGRNLPAAIASGVVLAALVVVSLVWLPWLFGVLAAAALCLAIHELTTAFASAGIRVARTPVYATTLVGMAAAYIWGTEALLITVGAGVVAVLMWRIRRGTDGYLRDASASVFLLGYVSLMAGFAMLMLAAPDGPWRIIVFILLTIGNDIGGYATGVLFGRHPIAPQVSPKKSWEGFGGSLVVQCLIGVGAFIWIFQAPWWQGLIMGAVLTVTATAGDFIESAIKRDLGVKDMGSLLPGHGGIMDRLDSLVINAFAAWALFALFLGQG
ncbi:MAG: phosphatidate cytidylyltransferase [Candidatus Nanopelagicales bacterium]|jgi:phosphatidate cytidylyltransferase